MSYESKKLRKNTKEIILFEIFESRFIVFCLKTGKNKRIWLFFYRTEAKKLKWKPSFQLFCDTLDLIIDNKPKPLHRLNQTYFLRYLKVFALLHALFFLEEKTGDAFFHRLSY